MLIVIPSSSGNMTINLFAKFLFQNNRELLNNQRTNPVFCFKI